MEDKKLVKWLLLLLLLPIGMAYFSDGDRFRYPCQNPDNWDKDFCKMPKCDVTRTCPEHIFKGQRDPRLGSAPDGQNQTITKPITTPATQSCAPVISTQGANCGK